LRKNYFTHSIQLLSVFSHALWGCGIESNLWPIAFKTLICHPSKQHRVHRLLQLGLIVGQCFVEKLLHPIHFSVYSCNEAIKCYPHADNDFSHVCSYLCIISITSLPLARQRGTSLLKCLSRHDLPEVPHLLLPLMHLLFERFAPSFIIGNLTKRLAFLLTFPDG